MRLPLTLPVAKLATLRGRLQQRLQAAGIQLCWEVESLPPLPWLTPRHALHVLRIVEEVTTNIIKHTQAGMVRIFTGIASEYVTICVQDDGGGFEPSPDQSSGRGLHNIRYRASILQAQVEWSAKTTARGTLFILRLPLERVAVVAYRAQPVGSGG